VIVIPGRAKREPEIHNHDWRLWISGLRQEAHPGMTVLKMEKHMKPGILFAVATLLAATVAARADVVRTPIPNSTFPIALAVQVPATATTYYVSGQVPPVVSKDADPASPQAYGDVKTQTVGVLNRIKGILEGLGLGMGDVVKMQVFLVHDARAPMDFKAFMEGYTQFFGGAQPNLPARSVVGVASLANPGFLVEIEVVAVKDAK
jgi:enamine deaminase RidA (YjgF/YER057c/UK114 family)